jgi:endoglucanase
VLRIRLANGGTQPLVNWQLSWTASNDFTMTNQWSGTFSVAGRAVTVLPFAWNASIAPNSAVELGMQLSYSGSKPVPSNAVVQGQTCTINIVTQR